MPYTRAVPMPSQRDVSPGRSARGQEIASLLESMTREVLDAINSRSFDADTIPWTYVSDDYQSAAATGSRGTANSKAEFLQMMKTMTDIWTDWNIHVKNLTTHVYESRHVKAITKAEVYMESEATGAPNVPLGLARPSVSVVTFKLKGKKWFMVEEVTISGVVPAG